MDRQTHHGGGIVSHYTREQIESWGPQSAELLRAALGETHAREKALRISAKALGTGELVAPAVARIGDVFTAVLPVVTASEANKSEHWRHRSKRTNNAWRVVSRTLGPHLDSLAPLALHYHSGGKLRIRFVRLGGRRLDRGNVPNSLKATEDALAFMLGASDGNHLQWLAEYDQIPGGASGVRVEMERA